MTTKKLIPTIPNKSQQSPERGPQKGAIYVPPAQQEKMKQMFIDGQSISEIARDTGRDFKTVAKIVRSADMQEFMEECKNKTWELIPDALDMIANEMQQAPDKD